MRDSHNSLPPTGNAGRRHRRSAVAAAHRLWIGAALTLISSLAAAQSSADKTLVAWAAPADLAQQGGSLLTIQSGEQFDAIVFGERVSGRWMAGSEFFRRTPGDQQAWAAETTSGPDLVQIAIVYQADQIRIYRDGQPYASYAAENIDLLGIDHHIAVFGLRHIGAGTGRPFAGAIEDARIYRRALTPAEIQALQPNQISEITPMAWWDFEGDQPRDRGGRFPHHALVGAARLDGGRLVLTGKGYLVAAVTEGAARLASRADQPRAPGPPYVPETPAWPDAPPADWLTFHLAHPGPGTAMPGDPNCAFDTGERYHLHYIYRNHTGFVFAHVSSDDLVHWRWHPTVLAPPRTGHGMFSGTGFLTKEGRPAIIYHGEGSGRNHVQVALDDQLDTWSEPEPVIPRTAAGDEPQIRHWDPDCWRMDDMYYAYSGGQNPQLMKSADLQQWTYLGDLLHADYPADLGVPRGEDISCGNMFQLGRQWMLLCISHGLGARYYLGDFRDEKYLPRSHAMMSFGGNHFFAPESLLTRDGRRVMWAWLLNLPIQPSGVQCLPRELELPADGVLRIRPLRELATLRQSGTRREAFTVPGDALVELDEVTGQALELEVTFASPLPAECGLRLLADERGEGGTSIAFGAGQRTLRVGPTEPPFELRPNEELTLRVFLDQNLVEVFANDRQAAVFAHPTVRENPRLQLFSRGGPAVVKSLQAWRIKSIYAPAAAAGEPGR